MISFEREGFGSVDIHCNFFTLLTLLEYLHNRNPTKPPSVNLSFIQARGICCAGNSP
jgi:hypothetical protein